MTDTTQQSTLIQQSPSSPSSQSSLSSSTTTTTTTTTTASFDFSSISQNNNIINALQMYARNGFKNELIKIIKKEGKSILQLADPFHRQTILHVITETGQDELFILLMNDNKYSKYIDINAIDFNGMTALHYACKGGYLEMIESLINKGAFVRALSNDSSTPLHYFVQTDFTNNLHFHRIFDLLVKKGGGSNFINIINKAGETALHHATLRSHFQSMLFLLNAKADPNIANLKGETALHYAAQNEKENCFELLLQFGGDPSLKSEKGDIYQICCNKKLIKIQHILQKWHFKTGKVIPPLLQESLDIYLSNTSPPSSHHLSRLSNDESSISDESSHSSINNNNNPPSSPKTENRSEEHRIRHRKSFGDSSKSSSEPSTPTMQKKKNNLFRLKRSNNGTSKQDVRSTTPPVNENHDSKEGKVTTIIENFERLSDHHHQNNNNNQKKVTKVAVNHTPRISSTNKLSLRSTISNDSISTLENSSPAKDHFDHNTQLPSSSQTFNISRNNKLSSIDSQKYSLSAALKKKFEGGWRCRYCDNKHGAGGVPLTFICVSPTEYEDLSDDAKETRSTISSDLCSIDNIHFFVRGLIEIPLIHRQHDNDNDNDNDDHNRNNNEDDGGGSDQHRDVNNNNTQNVNIKKVDRNTTSSDNDNDNDGERNNGDNNDDEEEKKINVILGVWVKLEAPDFYKIMEEWNSKTPFTVYGKLNNNLPITTLPSSSSSSSLSSSSSSLSSSSSTQLNNLISSSPSSSSSKLSTLNLSVSLTTRCDGLRPIVEIVNNPDHLLSLYQQRGISLDVLDPLLSTFIHHMI